MSDLVCSADITVGDALRKVSKLVNVVKELTDDPPESEENEDSSLDEETIVHKAVGILRKRMRKPKCQLENYYSCDEISTESMKEFVDPLLYKALGWLTNETLFSSGADIAEKDNLQCLNIACDITTLATSAMSPKHLGLAVYLHHEFGSRKLVEHLSSLGYCISYSGLRCFLTSAVVYMNSTQNSESGLFVPPQLRSKDMGGKLIISVGDNWDHNEQTVDGKNTTHAMTSIFVTPAEDGDKLSPPIPRVSVRSLDTELLQGNVNCYDFDVSVNKMGNGQDLYSSGKTRCEKLKNIYPLDIKMYVNLL